jgi:hypothetical protein
MVRERILANVLIVVELLHDGKAGRADRYYAGYCAGTVWPLDAGCKSHMQHMIWVLSIFAVRV